MTKAQVVIHSAASDSVIDRIYELGVLQAIQVVEDSAQEQAPLQNIAEQTTRIPDLEGRLREVTRALEILAPYDEAGHELIETFIAIKRPVSRQIVETTRTSFDYLGISKQLVATTERLKHLQDQQEWLQEDMEMLYTLEAIPFSLGDLATLKRAHVGIGRMRKENRDTFAKELAPYADDLYWEEINEKDQFLYLFFLCLPIDNTASDVPAIFERNGYDHIDLSGYSGRIPEELQRLAQELADVQQQIQQVEDEIRGFLQYKAQFKIIEEQLTNEITRNREVQNFAATQKVYFVEGWMKQRDKPRLQDALQDFAGDTEVIYTDADPHDQEVPVILENHRLIQPFEVITRMFSMPKYGEIDPTLALTPFFFVFFGLCLTDAGYGIMLALFMFWIMRTYILGEGTLLLARLLLYGGISTLICGALAGGWLGNVPDLMPASLSFITSIKNALTVIDPIKDPIKFLVMALILGYIQVNFGIFLKMKARLDRGDKQGAWLNEGIWLLLINSLFFLGILSIAAGDSVIGRLFIPLLKLTALGSAAVRIWYSKADEKNIVKRILLGILSLYDLTGIFSDVLSYSRLLALGLATGVIAMIIDMLTQMISHVPVIGVIFGMIIFCFGHVFNLIINTIGGFIHSGRLQFLEFFSKFYEGGGRKYKPFRFESKYFEITE